MDSHYDGMLLQPLPHDIAFSAHKSDHVKYTAATICVYMMTVHKYVQWCINTIGYLQYTYIHITMVEITTPTSARYM